MEDTRRVNLVSQEVFRRATKLVNFAHQEQFLRLTDHLTVQHAPAEHSRQITSIALNVLRVVFPLMGFHARSALPIWFRSRAVLALVHNVERDMSQI